MESAHRGERRREQDEYREYRQLATALEGQGLKEEAEHFAYRTQVMQRTMLWHRVGAQKYQRPMKLVELWVMQRTTFWQRAGAWWQQLRQCWADLWTFVFSLLLSVLTGYGYRLERALFWYGIVLVIFIDIYLWISYGQPVPSGWDEVMNIHVWLFCHQSKPLAWEDALILSVSNMVGRDFFRQDLLLSDPYAGWSVLEGVIGVFMDVLLISTLTQRLFEK